ncbi:uncharacterized protein [Penaeus vannamei]|uniref:uncharacterized protein n=1 Tax=Penaeus vannamei TaxID=6689 RepID=UPI00387F54BF
MLTRILLLCLACVVCGQDDFFDRYGYTKIMQNCFGASVYQEHLQTLLEAQRGCSGRSFAVMHRPSFSYNNVQDSDDPFRGFVSTTRNRNPFDLNYRPNDFQSGFDAYPEVDPTPFGSGNSDNYRPGFSQYPQVDPTPFGSGNSDNYRPGFPQYPQDTPSSTSRPGFSTVTPTTFRPGIPTTLRPGFPSTVRPGFPTTARPGFSTVILSNTPRPQYPDFSQYPPRNQDTYGFLVDGEQIRTSLYKVESGMGNFTCALQRLSVIDSNLNIIPQNINRLVFERVTDRNLRQDLLSGINFCREMVQCLPEDTVGTALRYKLQRILAFMKCEKKTRLDACLKHDLRQNIQRFDLSALPDDGGRTGPLEKLMTILVGAESLDQLELY